MYIGLEPLTLSWGSLITQGLSKDIQSHKWHHSSLGLHIIHKAKWAVSLVIMLNLFPLGHFSRVLILQYRAFFLFLLLFFTIEDFAKLMHNYMYMCLFKWNMTGNVLNYVKCLFKLMAIFHVQISFLTQLKNSVKLNRIFEIPLWGNCFESKAKESYAIIPIHVK